MLSPVDLERLITEKTREIEREKLLLGLAPSTSFSKQEIELNKDNGPSEPELREELLEDSDVSERKDAETEEEERHKSGTHQKIEPIAPELERYIRRYLGLPVMLKAGEFSPNNPLLKECRVSGAANALFALGEYERQRDTLRRIQQIQYREYLDQQAKTKQEEKEKAERKRRDQEERDRIREQRERERLTFQWEREEARRPNLCYYGGVTSNFNKRVDASVQVGGVSSPLSVAVQTDEDLFTLNSPSKRSVQAERELSPRAVIDNNSFDDKPVRKLSKSYTPSILDAEAIRIRNEKAEKEAAERRQFYQKELKNQIQEQQRLRDERKHREKMLEQAEMRRLEEQLRMLKMAQERETHKQTHINSFMYDSTSEFEKRRKQMQKDIDIERNKLRTKSQPSKTSSLIRETLTSQSDNTEISKIPLYYPTVLQDKTEKPPFSTNIPENSIFSPDYDVDAYLRKNLNPSNVSLYRLDSVCKDIDSIGESRLKNTESNVLIEKALIHDIPKRTSKVTIDDNLPIPVLRHSPNNSDVSFSNKDKLSDAMKKVEHKWQVPAVQKNILKNLPNGDGQKVSILTQLGSIRRQLQLEQLKLDNMLGKGDS